MKQQNKKNHNKNKNKNFLNRLCLLFTGFCLISSCILLTEAKVFAVTAQEYRALVFKSLSLEQTYIAEGGSPEISRQEALDIALSVMGLSFERKMAVALRTQGTDVAETMSPFPPDVIIYDMGKPLEDAEIDAVLAWLAKCKSGFVWEASAVMSEGAELFIRREGVGAYSKGANFVLQMDIGENAQALKESIEAQGLGAKIIAGPLLQVGPFKSAQEALNAAERNPSWPGPVCVDLGSQNSPALFYAYVKFDPKKFDISTPFAEKTANLGRAPLSYFNKNSTQAILLNGGYFAGSRPLGTMLINGHHTGKPLPGRSAFGWSATGTPQNAEGGLVFGGADAYISLNTPMGAFEFTNYSKAPEDNGLALLVPSVADNFQGINQDTKIYTIKGGIVQNISSPHEVSFAQNDFDFAIAARGRSLARLGGLQIGHAVSVGTQWFDPVFEGADYVIQGGPMLLKDGASITATEGLSSPIVQKRHPRTAVGTDGVNLIFLIVDGRNELHSRGATMDELRARCRNIGMTTALNLDGGGSTQLIWRGVTINMPSDGKERPLPYAIKIEPLGN